MTDLTAAYAAAIALGSAFGFQGSVSPGPLQTLLISETLSNGVRSSWRAAFAPVMSDPIALAIALLVVSNVPNWAIAAIAFGGAFILCKIAWGELRTTADDFDFQKKPRRSLLQIWTVNMTNPNLWIFAFTINGLQVHDYFEKWGIGVAAAYLLSFFIVCTFFNLLTVVVVGACKQALNTKILAAINKALGGFLLFVAARFVYIGLCKLNVIQHASEPIKETALMIWTEPTIVLNWVKCSCVGFVC